MIQQNTSDWLELRKRSVGASDAPIIMGASPWKTPYQLWEEKMGLRENLMNDAMRRGHELEETVRKAFEQSVGVVVFPVVKFHPQNKWMIASMDGVTLDGKIAVELKTANKTDHQGVIEGRIPDKYYPQLQHQMAVGGWTSMYYCSWHDGDCRHLVVKRNDDYIVNMIEKEQQFLHCMRTATPPEYTERDYQNQDSEQWQQLISEYRKASETNSLSAQLMEEIKNQLIAMSGGSNSKGAGATLTKATRKGLVNYSQIPELQGVDVDVYRKSPSTYWSLRLE